jgi:hypothetical protein
MNSRRFMYLFPTAQDHAGCSRKIARLVTGVARNREGFGPQP